jgi:hypothetical protein
MGYLKVEQRTIWKYFFGKKNHINAANKKLNGVAKEKSSVLIRSLAFSNCVIAKRLQPTN